MLTMLIKLTAFATSALLAQAQTEPTNEIREVDSGSCWVQGSEASGWKVASFNDDSTFFVFKDEAILSDPHRFGTKLTAQLKNIFPSFEASNYKMHLHCSGIGHQVLITVESEKTPLCVWAKKSENSNLSLDIQKVLPNPEGDPNSMCYGVSPASFLFTVTEGNDPALLGTYLSKKYRSNLESIRVSKMIGYVHLVLKPRFAFKERELRAHFMKDPKISAVVRRIEFDGAVTMTGESLLLLNDTYSGY